MKGHKTARYGDATTTASRIREGNSTGMWEVETVDADGRSWEMWETRALALDVLAYRRWAARVLRQALNGPRPLAVKFLHRGRR